MEMVYTCPSSSNSSKYEQHATWWLISYSRPTVWLICLLLYGQLVCDLVFPLAITETISSSPSSFEEQKFAVFKKINKRILNAPVGSLTKDMINEAKICMEASICQTHRHDPRNVETLLKRIVLEKNVNNKVPMIGIEWYNIVLHAWMMSIQCFPNSDREEKQNLQAEQRIFEILHFMVSSYVDAKAEKSTKNQQAISDSRFVPQYSTQIKPNLMSFCLVYSSLSRDRYENELNQYIIPSLKFVLFDEHPSKGFQIKS